MDSLFWTSRQHWWERVNNSVIESHLSERSGSYWARTRMDRVVDKDATDCAISPPPDEIHISQLRNMTSNRHVSNFLIYCSKIWRRNSADAADKYFRKVLLPSDIHNLWKKNILEHRTCITLVYIFILHSVFGLHDECLLIMMNGYKTRSSSILPIERH